MSDAQEEHVGKVSLGGRNITNLRFADDIDALAEEEQELAALVESLHKTFTRYKMKISAEKTKLMTNSANGIQSERDKGKRAFRYHGAVVSDDGSKPEVLSRIAQATAAFTKLKPTWSDNKISLGSKVKLMCSFVIYVISIFLNACESWTLTAELEKRMQAFEMRCYRRLLIISYKDHVTYEEVRRKIQAAIGEYIVCRTPGPGQETEAKMVWPCFKVFWSSKDNPTGQKIRKISQFFLKKMPLLTTCYIALFCIGMST